jgi:hypothetical protein
MRMRITSWSIILGIVGVSAIAVSACTATVNGGSTGDDGGTPTDDSSTSTDSGTDTGTPGTDGSTIVVTDASGDAGIVCDTTGITDTCDLCALNSCCQAEDTCQSEPTDATTTDCQDIFTCVQDCIVPSADSGLDAGLSLDDCTSACSASHTTQGVADFAALSSCLATNCSTQCQ